MSAYDVYIAVWATSALICAGLHFAFWQGEYPHSAAGHRARELFWAISLGIMEGLLGPLGVLWAAVLTRAGRHGWRLTPRGPSGRVFTTVDGTTYDLGPAASIKCPQCALTSYHPKDIEHRFCGNCHMFHHQMKTAGRK